MVKLGEAPIDKSKLYASRQMDGSLQCEFPYFSRFVINHHVVWFNVAMHDAFGMAEIESLQSGLLRALAVQVARPTLSNSRM